MQPSPNIHVPWRQLASHLPLLLEQRLSPEIALTCSDLDLEEPEAFRRVGRQLASAGLSVSVHAPFFDLNPGSPDPAIRSVTRSRLEASMVIARDLNSHLVVIHPGFDRWRYRGQEAQWLTSSSAFFRDLFSLIEKLELKIALENIFEIRPDTLIQLINAINHPRIGHCFDIGHWHLFGQQVPLEQWLDAVAPQLLHLHLHDNFGQEDDHLPIGAGSIDFAPLRKFLAGLHCLPTMTLEIHSPEKLKTSLQGFSSILP